jgi:uncharacterized protein (DUF488 family)
MIYTLGTSTRSLEQFIEILKKFAIEIVIDVRHFPTSKRFPWFCRKNLERKLRKVGIEYVWLEKLGGYRKEGYLSYTKTKEYKEGLERVIKLAKNKRVCIVCAELLWFRCHRRFISDDLVFKGFEIVHIFDKDRVEKHECKKLIERRVWCDKKAKKHGFK